MAGVETEPELVVPKPLRCVNRRVVKPFVCMNNNGFVVLLYQNEGRIFYVVGKISGAGGEEERDEQESPLSHGIEWGVEKSFVEGCNVQAAINENGIIVLVRSKLYARTCHFSVGKLEETDKYIKWSQTDERLCSGVNPTVAMVGNTVLFFHESDYGLYRSYCNVGKLEENNLQITGQRDCRVRALDGYKEVSVAITNENKVVVSCRTSVGSNLFYGVGQLDSSLGELNLVRQYASGYYSRISVLNNGIVVDVHESKVGAGLLYTVGKLQTNDSTTTVSWFDSHRYDSGYYPSVAVCDNYCMIEVHTALRVNSRLWHRLGKLSETRF